MTNRPQGFILNESICQLKGRKMKKEVAKLTSELNNKANIIPQIRLNGFF